LANSDYALINSTQALYELAIGNSPSPVAGALLDLPATQLGWSA
jgi:hypothetical protein